MTQQGQVGSGVLKPGSGRLTFIALDLDPGSLGRRQLERMAEVSGGQFLDANDPQALTGVLATVVSGPPLMGGGGAYIPPRGLGFGPSPLLLLLAANVLLVFLIWYVRHRGARRSAAFQPRESHPRPRRSR